MCGAFLLERGVNVEDNAEDEAKRRKTEDGPSPKSDKIRCQFPIGPFSIVGTLELLEYRIRKELQFEWSHGWSPKAIFGDKRAQITQVNACLT